MLNLHTVATLAAGATIALGIRYAAVRVAAALAPKQAPDTSKTATHHRLSNAEGGWAETPGVASAHELEDGGESGRGTRVFRLAITGGPCGGKSSSLVKLKTALNKQGYDMYSVPEAPTMLMNGGCRYPGINGGFLLAEFEGALIQLQLQLERSYTRIAASTGRPSVVVMDRGLLDIKAYLPADQWAAVLEATDLSEEYLLERYDAVLHLVTAADGADEFYKYGHTTDDSGVSVYREEAPAKARELDKKVRDAWCKHPRQGIIKNLSDGFSGKMARSEAFVTCLLDAVS